MVLLMTAPASRADEREAVVLLHGLGRTERSMRPLEQRLEREGYRVHNLGYPSRQHDAEQLIALLAAEVERCCRDAPRVHFVGHSLGGLLARAYLAEAKPPNLGRLVMLAPPNHGSELVDRLGEPFLRFALGPVAPALGTDGNSLPRRLPPPHFEVGVIAGTRSINPIGSALIPGPNDGTVSVESTRLEGMSDFALVPASHPFIMRSPRVAELVLAFLASGQFYPAPSS
jgi:pimeloyl-ACP methyl ester carboxylesterase